MYMFAFSARNRPPKIHEIPKLFGQISNFILLCPEPVYVDTSYSSFVFKKSSFKSLIMYISCHFKITNSSAKYGEGLYVHHLPNTKKFKCF